MCRFRKYRNVFSQFLFSKCFHDNCSDEIFGTLSNIEFPNLSAVLDCNLGLIIVLLKLLDITITSMLTASSLTPLTYGIKSRLFDSLPTAIKNLNAMSINILCLIKSCSFIVCPPPHLIKLFSHILSLSLTNCVLVAFSPYFGQNDKKYSFRHALYLQESD